MFEYGVAAIVATAVVAVLSHVATRKYYALKAKASIVADPARLRITGVKISRSTVRFKNRCRKRGRGSVAVKRLTQNAQIGIVLQSSRCLHSFGGFTGISSGFPKAFSCGQKSYGYLFGRMGS